MRLDALILADAVSAPPDGKFYVLGGGMTRLTVPMLPYPIPQLGVLIRLATEEDEIGASYRFGFDLIDPRGSAVGKLPEFASPLPAPPPEAPPPAEGEERFVVLAINIAGIIVTEPGLHRFEFRLDGELQKAIPLPVVKLNLDELAAIGPPSHLPPGPPPPNRAERRRAQHQQRQD